MSKALWVIVFIVVFAASAFSERESSSERELEDDVDEAVGCVQRELEDASISPEIITRVADDIRDDLFEFVTVDPNSESGYEKYEFYNAKGFSRANTTDPDVVNAAKNAAHRYSEENEYEKFYYKPLVIFTAESKVVPKQFFNQEEHTAYRMILSIQRTDCKKSEVSYSNIDNCNFSYSGHPYRLCQVIEYPKEKFDRIGNGSFQDCNVHSKAQIDYLTNAIQGTGKVNYPYSGSTRPPR